MKCIIANKELYVGNIRKYWGNKGICWGDVKRFFLKEAVAFSMCLERKIRSDGCYFTGAVPRETVRKPQQCKIFSRWR